MESQTPFFHGTIDQGRQPSCDERGGPKEEFLCCPPPPPLKRFGLQTPFPSSLSNVFKLKKDKLFHGPNL
jgi:hypothetical protein